MIVSFLHFGQYRGKFLNSVSSRIIVRALLPQIGQAPRDTLSRSWENKMRLHDTRPCKRMKLYQHICTVYFHIQSRTAPGDGLRFF